MQGVVVFSIGNRTLYYPQIRGLLVKLTVIWRLPKFVIYLHKIALSLRASKEEVVYIEGLKHRVFEHLGLIFQRIKTHV